VGGSASSSSQPVKTFTPTPEQQQIIDQIRKCIPAAYQDRWNDPAFQNDYFAHRQGFLDSGYQYLKDNITNPRTRVYLASYYSPYAKKMMRLRELLKIAFLDEEELILA
jgi:hypothetical protein